MSAAVTELEAGLQAMQALKPPGVSGTRIKDITALCTANVKSESLLIQKIFTHFKRAPGTHKLGVLYVVDSVTRKWMDQAKQQGQTISSAAEDGSFAAGVNRVTELMPLFMSDILASAPEDQKEKIRKLFDIWEKGQTFPATMVEGWKSKLNAPKQSTTPAGSPQLGALAALTRGSTSSAPAPVSVTSNIMETLANIARLNASAASSNPSISAPSAPAAVPAFLTSAPPMSSSVLPPALAALAQQHQHQHQQQQPQPQPQPQQQAAYGALASAGLPFFPPAVPGPAPPAPAAAQPVMPGLSFQLPPQLQLGLGAAGQPMPPTPSPLAAAFGPSSQANGLNGFAPTPAPPQMDNVQQQVVLIQTLLAQGIAPEMVTAIMQSMNVNGGAAAPAGANGAQYPGQQGSNGLGIYGAGANNGSSANGGWNPAGGPGEARDSHDSRARSPQGRGPRGRSRSRSPGRHWDSRHSPPRGRGGDDRERDRDGGRGRLDDRERDRGRGGPRSEYRQRSPPGQGRRSPSPRREGQSGRHAERFLEFDRSLPQGSIRVLSRTLFIGGVTSSENELRSVFSRYGEVQSCIVNKEKRHAFVKMYTRKDAGAAKEAMADTRNTEHHQLRTRWGVGFGPRDCSDYQAGISIVPIHRLTDADRKWLVTAPFGGTGGKPIESGMVIEEPDIEIGAGVSSKAISRRMQTDRGGVHGPKSTHQEDDSPQQHNRGNSFGGGGGGGRRRGNAGGRDSNRRGGGDGRGGGGAGGSTGGGGGDNGASVADFGFGISVGPNGMPVYPPGFSFPDPNNKNNA